MPQPTPNPRASSFMLMLFKYIGYLEIVAIVVVFIGFGLKYLHSPGATEILMLSMSTLAAIYFLGAYQPVDRQPGEENVKFGFAELLGLTILPKVIGIGCAVCIIGILFDLLHLHGGAEMLMIGTSVLAASIFISMILILGNSERYAHLIKSMYRAIPIFIFGAYTFYIIYQNLPKS